MQNDASLEKLQFIKKQFLFNVPVKEISWTEFGDLNTDIQEGIINNTSRLPQVLKYPINLEYQKGFLKHLLQHLERQGSAIHDCVYEEYGRLVALASPNFNFKHYNNIILKENIHLISEGTTGLRTWQASLALCEWITSNTPYFDSKVVLELGSGVGLTGLVLSIHCKPKTVYVTDCHPSVLATLCDNIRLNSTNNGDKNINLHEQCLLEEHINCSVVRVLNLPWEDFSKDLCENLGHIDTIIAADVVYDKSIFVPLVSAVDCLFKYCGASEFILSCTKRNEETLDEFFSLLRRNYSVGNIEVPGQNNFVWPPVPPVGIFKISR